MPAHFLIKHWKKELQVFYRNLLVLQKASDPGAIHDLRVSIKKLRSYFRLYEAVFRKNEDSPFPPGIKNLFTALGRQRNIEITLEQLHHFKKKEVSSELEKHFQFYLSETSQLARSALRQFDPSHLEAMTLEIDQTITHAETANTRQELLPLIRTSVAAVAEYLKDFPKNYHLVRKKLKDIFYWSAILPADLFFDEQESKLLKKILDSLGDAQDQQIFRKNVQFYRKTILAKGSETHAEVKQIEKRSKEKTERFLKNAFENTTELLNKKLAF